MPNHPFKQIQLMRVNLSAILRDSDYFESKVCLDMLRYWSSNYFLIQRINKALLRRRYSMKTFFSQSSEYLIGLINMKDLIQCNKLGLPIHNLSWKLKRLKYSKDLVKYFAVAISLFIKCALITLKISLKPLNISKSTKIILGMELEQRVVLFRLWRITKIFYFTKILQI